MFNHEFDKTFEGLFRLANIGLWTVVSLTIGLPVALIVGAIWLFFHVSVSVH